MSLAIDVSNNGRCITFYVEGEFDSSIKFEVQDVTERHGPGALYLFDFSRVTSVRSSGVGMLIVMRQDLGGAHANIKLINCGARIRETLACGGLQSLFIISRIELEAA